MKKIPFLFFSFLFLLLSVITYAQETTSKHEFSISYGFAPVTSIPELNLPATTEPNTHFSTNNERLSGTINISYLYHLSDPFAIGLSYSYGTVKRDIVIGSSIPLAGLKNKCHIVMFTGKYAWLRLKQFSFYSRAAVGIMVVKKGDMNILSTFEGDIVPLSSATMENDKCFAWQAMPLGVEWNFVKHLALFAEGGVGSAGCGIAGIKILF